MVSIVSVNHHGKEGFRNGKDPEICQMTHFSIHPFAGKFLQFKKNNSVDTKHSKNDVSKIIN